MDVVSANAHRVSPRKRRRTESDTVLLRATFLSKSEWGLRTFGDVALYTFCVAYQTSRRDQSPSYGFTVPALSVCGQSVYPDNTIWLTDIQRRDFHALWKAHQSPTDKHYTLHHDIDSVKASRRVMLHLRTSGVQGALRHNMTIVSSRSQLIHCLELAVRRLTRSNVPGPGWKDNSCHIDSYLLSELAFYTASGCTNIIDDPANLPKCVQRLLRVLLTLGRHGSEILNQDSARDDYREFELSSLPTVERRMLENQHGMADYTWHGHMTCALAHQEGAAIYIRDERMLGCCLIKTCTHQNNHRDSPTACPEMVYNTHIRAPTHWYAVSDATASAEMSASQCSNGGAAVAHSTLRNVLLSHILRPVGDELPCDHEECMKLNHGARRKYAKQPHRTSFPRSLELDRGENRSTAPHHVEFSITLGIVKYELISIVLQNADHYRTIVRLGDAWWDYDDMRVGNDKPGEGAQKKGMLVHLGGHDKVLVQLSKLRRLRRSFHPRVWRYSRIVACPEGQSWSDTLDTSSFNTICFNDPSVHGAGTPVLNGGTW